MPKGPVYIRSDFKNSVFELTDEQVEKLVELAKQLEQEEETTNIFETSKSAADLMRECAESEEGHTFSEGDHGVCTKCSLSVVKNTSSTPEPGGQWSRVGDTDYG